MTRGARVEDAARDVVGESGSPTGNLADISRLTSVLGRVVAPATLVTALLFYFGWSFAYWFFDYLGVNSTVLGLTTQDYLMRSVDGLFFPMMVAALAALAASWGRALLRERVDPALRLRVERVAVPVCAVTGALLLVNGVSRVFVETVLNGALVVAPLSLASGVLLLAYAVHARRRRRRFPDEGAASSGLRSLAEWAAVFVLVGLGLFWAANDYSAALGETRARELVASLPEHPSTVVYSEKSLGLRIPGVSEVRCSGSGTAYGFRYDGLTLVLQSSDQYLLLPTSWTTTSGVAVVLPRTAAVRLEFVRPSARAAAAAQQC